MSKSVFNFLNSRVNKKVQISIFKKLHKFNENTLYLFCNTTFLNTTLKTFILRNKKNPLDTVLERISFKYNWVFFSCDVCNTD